MGTKMEPRRSNPLNFFLVEERPIWSQLSRGSVQPGRNDIAGKVLT